jgi:hypothetical protein
MAVGSYAGVCVCVCVCVLCVCACTLLGGGACKIYARTDTCLGQGFCAGCAVEGVARWGAAPLFHRDRQATPLDGVETN